MQKDRKRAYIVGGGFSYYAGLPLTSGFTRALIAARDPDSGRSGALVRYLERFVNRTFGISPNSSQDWPSLEDLFTCIDLAANSGHHLGGKYSPAKLRTIRRCLLARIMRMLYNRQHHASLKKSKEWKILKKFLSGVDYASDAFLSMNWDDVIETRFFLIHTGAQATADYGCDAIHVQTDGRKLFPQKLGTGPVLRIAKIHGSVNWLYCDNCQRTFWFEPYNNRRISNRLLSNREWREVAPSAKFRSDPWKCPFCEKVRLSTRLATFSYRKALDFPMFQKSWFTAENLLRRADTWAFIGYSLPAADFEFKYLLKKIQLSRQRPPRIVLVTGGADAEATRNTYQRFFGEAFEADTDCFLEGLNDDSVDCLLRS